MLVRINLVLFVAFAIGFICMDRLSRSLLESNARREVLAEAGLMMDSAAAIRAYTATEIEPLLDDKMAAAFRPQSVPSYSATQNFLALHERHPDYSYKEATLNPTNPRDRATDWEADIVEKFRNDARAKELSGARDTPVGRTLYLARPLRAGAECLVCHSLPAAAPATLIQRYGSNNGFGWQAGEVVGAQIVSVPLAAAEASAATVLDRLRAGIAAVFLLVLVVVNAALYVIVIRPLRHIASVADRISLGDLSAPELSVAGGHEVATLAASFGRMRRSLEKALRMLEP